MINLVTGKKKVLDDEGRREKFVRIRMYIVVGICFIGFATALSRAVYLHLVDNVKLSKIAESQYTAHIPVNIRRGKIFDRNGAELAVSLPVPSISADPTLVKDPEKTAEELGKLLHIDTKKILSRLKSSKHFVYIKRRISYNTLKNVLKLNLPGVSYVEESKRFYPNGELASQILGAVGYDSEARAGIEMAYSDLLVSKKKLNSFKKDAHGKFYATPLSFSEQSDVGQIYLTIDKQIQFVAENALRHAVKKANAKDGVVVVMDPTNGDILAMASASIFDPNKYSKYPQSSWRNRAVTDAFEPGSTFKIFIVASALQNGIVNAESVYNCENGAIRVGKDVLRDHHPYGDLSVQDVIKYSSNIGSLKIAFDLGKERLFETLKEFGIGSKTEVDYPGEVGGILRDYKGWQKVEHATVAFGQGLTATPLQMTAAFAAAINGGLYYKPRLVARIVDRDGKLTYSEPEVVSNPIREDVSEMVRYMLRRVVEEGGTGTRARSNAYSIGGKTGTAQKVTGGASGYAKGKYFASFIGFAPVEDPKLVVFVGIDEPKGAYYGGVVAAPVVKEIVERSLHYMGVPSSVSPIVEMAEVAPKSLDYQERYREEKRRADFKVLGDGKFVMPDLSGLAMRDVLKAAAEAGIEVDTEGSGVAILQNPEAGSVIESGNKFYVGFRLPK